ncbi:unnamed protein product [Fraxinus pennsylvanica]|uniref:OTU domain-containing protein n=1 Tax=Fraxinus pennsylvanica TaxID=56036 RepID=A0AAD1YKV7_9LAMI|nr:unnamed protein product [Fraxinus pennsylvanica]
MIYLNFGRLGVENHSSDGRWTLADQLEGNEDEYNNYRSMVVKFIKNKREMFEPFIEDEVPFDKYCKSMSEAGTSAGHMELQAASLVARTNICIHRHMSPCWYKSNFDKSEAGMIHLLQFLSNSDIPQHILIFWGMTFLLFSAYSSYAVSNSDYLKLYQKSDAYLS